MRYIIVVYEKSSKVFIIDIVVTSDGNVGSTERERTGKIP